MISSKKAFSNFKLAASSLYICWLLLNSSLTTLSSLIYFCSYSVAFTICLRKSAIIALNAFKFFLTRSCLVWTVRIYVLRTRSCASMSARSFSANCSTFFSAGVGAERSDAFLDGVGVVAFFPDKAWVKCR